MTLRPAPLNRVLEGLEDTPAPDDTLDVDHVVRRGARRRRTRRAIAGSVMAVAVAAIGTGVLMSRPPDPTQRPAVEPRSTAIAHRASVGSGGAMPRGGDLSDLADSAKVVTQAQSMDTFANGLDQLTPANAARDYSLPVAAAGSVTPDRSQDPSIISTGDVVLHSKDVDAARGQILDVVTSVGGQLSDEQTRSDSDGELTSDQLVLRVPSKDFTSAVNRLGGIGTRVSSVTHAEDVTAKVVDTEARLSIQRASVDRIQKLLDRARSIRDIVSIEGQLSEREATLESLEKQQKYLAGQTTRATITVQVTRVDPKAAAKPDEGTAGGRQHGFTGGLSIGWHKMMHAGSRLLVRTGEAVPFAGVLLIIAIPLLIIGRRFRRRWEASLTGP